MQLSFAPVSPLLRRYVLSYYLLEDEGAHIEDVQRADVGALTFVLEGKGHFEFADGSRSPTTPVFINGPTTTGIGYSAWGPLRFFGLSPQPDFWGGIANCDAEALADTAMDAVSCFPPDPMPVWEALRARTTVEEMAPIMDAWLLSMLNPLPPETQRNIDTIRAWLANEDSPDLADLHAAITLTERQIARIANRYFGAPPKGLARKYRALRTASAIAMGDDAAIARTSALYSDNSHMIREVRRVTRQTPRQLRLESNMVIRMTLHPHNFRELLPID